jgi:diguanylate cyclase (GGDEF)-like protein
MTDKQIAETLKSLSGQFVGLLDSLSSLQALSTLDSRSIDEGLLLKRSLQILLENHGFDRCSIFVLRNDELSCVAGLDWSEMSASPEDIKPPVPGKMRFRLGEGIAGVAAQTGHAYISNDVAKDPRFVESDMTPEKGSLICIPVRCNNETLGVINAFHPEEGYFTHDHERSMTLFASFLGQLILNNRYIVKVNELIDERTQELRSALNTANEMREKYHELSLVDELTGLHNRRHFFPEARSIIAHCLRTGSSLCLILIDLDNFKTINDNFGHSSGDAVLEQTAAILRQCIREGDILSRMGGEEFVILLRDTSEPGAKQIAERVRTRITNHHWSGVEDLPQVTATMGVSCWRRQEDTADAEKVLDKILKEADLAMYYGKDHGRDQVILYNDIK